MSFDPPSRLPAAIKLKDDEIVHNVDQLIKAPGVRLVMPSEQSEDFMNGLRYTGLGDQVIIRSSSDQPIHDYANTTYARVFANEIAEPYMKSEKLRFPVGSMIVREKLGNARDQNPELIAVMIKRERGYNRFNQDWEFVVVDKDLGRVKRGDNVQSCMTCHAVARGSDLVFKTYLK